MATNFYAHGNKVLVGWNQILKATTGGNDYYIKASNFQLGLKQEASSPDLVTSLTDRIAFQKGTISIEGSINLPLTNSVGNSLVKAAANVALGTGAITLNSSMLPTGIGIEALINSCTIDINAGEPINVTCQFIGRLVDVTDSSKFTSAAAETYTVGVGNIAGVSEIGYETEQILMFDRLKIYSAFLPDSNTMIPTKLSFVIENNLQANYVLAVDSDGSLAPFSIAPGQRRLRGELTYQSGSSANSKLGLVVVAGASGCNAEGNLFEIQKAGACDSVGSENLLAISGDDFFPVWSAASPSVSTGVITNSISYTLIAKTAGIHTII